MLYSIRIPADQWDRMLSCCCSSQLLRHPEINQRALPVSAERWESRRYIGFRTTDIAVGSSRIEAYQIVPREEYGAPTTVHFQDDHVGYEVLYKNQLFVCNKRVDLIKFLPASAPVAMAEAQARAASSMDLTGCEIWSEYLGHPTFRTHSFAWLVYRSHDGRMRIDNFDLSCFTDPKARKQFLLI